MKQLILSSIFIILPFIGYSQIIQQIDEFTGKTSLKMEATKDLPVEQGEIIKASMQAIIVDDSYGLMLTTISKEYPDLASASDIYFLIDGQRITKRAHDVDSAFKSGFVAVQKVVLVNKAFFSSISKAEKVRFKWGQSVFAIPTDIKKDIAELANY